MSLYIKGLDMPKGEDICLTWRIRRKDLNAVHYQPIRKKDIIEIPTPHGRLIDMDELLSHLSKDPLFDLVERYGVSGVIESRPTILEAED